MRDLLKKYYEMSENTRENLGNLYIIHEFENLLNEFENLNITSLEDTETIIKIAIECWNCANIDGGEIIYRILYLLNENEITIEELKEMDIENVIELISFADDDFQETLDNLVIYEEFIFKDLKCTILNDEKNFILIYEQNNHTAALIFRKFFDMLCYLVNYGKSTVANKEVV